LAGTVDVIVSLWVNGPIKDELVPAWAAGAIAKGR
jgi:hypothetical protein